MPRPLIAQRSAWRSVVLLVAMVRIHGRLNGTTGEAVPVILDADKTNILGHLALIEDAQRKLTQVILTGRCCASMTWSA
jgi:hypothetical protein